MEEFNAFAVRLTHPTTGATALLKYMDRPRPAFFWLENDANNARNALGPLAAFAQVVRVQVRLTPQ